MIVLMRIKPAEMEKTNWKQNLCTYFCLNWCWWSTVLIKNRGGLYSFTQFVVWLIAVSPLRCHFYISGCCITSSSSGLRRSAADCRPVISERIFLCFYFFYHTCNFSQDPKCLPFFICSVSHVPGTESCIFIFQLREPLTFWRMRLHVFSWV